MNLHGIVSNVVSAVNSKIVGQYLMSTGATTGPSGKRIATWAPPIDVYLQVQPLSAGDIRKLDGLNLQGTMRKIFLNGQVDGIVRPRMKGGDLLVIPNGVNAGTWLVNQVLEQWPDWACAAVTLQNGA